MWSFGSPSLQTKPKINFDTGALRYVDTLTSNLHSIFRLEIFAAETPSPRYPTRLPKEEIPCCPGEGSSSDYEPEDGPAPWVAEPRSSSQPCLKTQYTILHSKPVRQFRTTPHRTKHLRRIPTISKLNPSHPSSIIPPPQARTAANSSTASKARGKIYPGNCGWSHYDDKYSFKILLDPRSKTGTSAQASLSIPIIHNLAAILYTKSIIYPIK